MLTFRLFIAYRDRIYIFKGLVVQFIRLLGAYFCCAVRSWNKSKVECVIFLTFRNQPSPYSFLLLRRGSGSRTNVCVIIESMLLLQVKIITPQLATSTNQPTIAPLNQCHVDPLSISRESYKTHFLRSTVYHCLYNFSAATSTSSRSRLSPIGNYSFSFEDLNYIRILLQICRN